MTGWNTQPLRRHCERSEAIQSSGAFGACWLFGLDCRVGLRPPRNDGLEHAASPPSLRAKRSNPESVPAAHVCCLVWIATPAFGLLAMTGEGLRPSFSVHHPPSRTIQNLMMESLGQGDLPAPICFARAAQEELRETARRAQAAASNLSQLLKLLILIEETVKQGPPAPAPCGARPAPRGLPET
jgi:hypothetical protein